jgi:hypothetical protein
MIETLYKTEAPEKEKSERYVLVLTPRPASHGTVYSFMEEHCRWDDSQMRLLHEVTSINAEGQMSYEAGLSMYNNAKMLLAERGFVHSFAPDWLRKKPKSYPMFQAEPALASLG